MDRSCQCGGVIREAGKPYWDILPNCTCKNPVAIKQQLTYTTTTTSTQDDTLATNPDKSFRGELAGKADTPKLDKVEKQYVGEIGGVPIISDPEATGTYFRQPLGSDPTPATNIEDEIDAIAECVYQKSEQDWARMSIRSLINSEVSKAVVTELEYLRAHCDPMFLDNVYIDSRIARYKGANNE